MKEHKLKTWSNIYQLVKSGEKTWELRNNDRDFKTGDILILEEYDNETKKYSGDLLKYKAGFILYGGQFGLPDEICIITLEKV